MEAMAKTLGMTLVSLLSLTLGACGGDDEGGGATLVVATYNAGLARSFVDYAVERTPAVAEALAAEELDVLCLQEAWEQEDWEALATASDLPHSHRLDADPGDSDDMADAVAVCSQEEVTPLEECVREMCDVPPGELTSCALVMCADDVSALSTECLGCITGVIGDLDIDGVVAACGPDGAGGGSAYTYGGSFGTGLLSALPLTGEDSLVMESTTTRRALLYAQIEAEDGEAVHVFCTHLTANLAAVPYTGEAGGWEEENRDQVDTLLEYVDEKAGDGRVILLGDLNSGPAVDGGSAELADNYDLLAEAFDNPFAEQDDASCSFCDDNSLQGADASDAVLIDHVMLGNWADYDATGEIFLSGEVTIEVEDEEVETALSDHYGVRLTLEY